MSQIRDDKRTEEVKLRLTERELLDASRMAAIEERSVAEFITRLLRSSMCGSVAVRLGALQGTLRGAQGRSGTMRAGQGRAGALRAAQ